MKISIDSVRLMNHVFKCTGEIMPDGIDSLVDKIGAQLGAVEEVTDLSKKYSGIIIAKVVSCLKHPNADKLSVCLIDDGRKIKNVSRDKDGYVQVVCGAPNVREGLIVAWLPPGATVPSSVGKEPFVLEARELRGEISNGMLASSSELALSDDHSGILEITEKLQPGDDFVKAYGLNGHVIDIENKMFTHRPDCFGVLGVAREIAGIQQMAFLSPDWYTQKPKFEKPSDEKLKLVVKNNVPELVPRFAAIAISNIKMGPSPTWLQIELAKVGFRPINVVVDYTNYFMHLTGQPLHAYDVDKLFALQARAKSNEQTAVSLETRMSKKGEKIKLLNGKELTFEDDSTVLITSGDQPVGIAGVMGGADTEVDASTTSIVLECANFDMYSMRRTSMRYGLFTDAVTRFNKGQSPLQNLAVLAKITNAICETTGGKVASHVVDDDHTSQKPSLLRVSVGFVNERLGSELTASDMQKLLQNVEFNVERTDNLDELKITPPFWRTDIAIAEDIVEEVGRLVGYDKLPLVLPARDMAPVQKDKLLEIKSQIRQVLSRAGANEVLTYSFVPGRLFEKTGQDSKLAYEISNSLSPDLQYYRLSIMPSLLDKIHSNIKAGFDEFVLFEIGKGHNKKHVIDSLPVEFEIMGLVFSASDKKSADYVGSAFYHARKYLDFLAMHLGVVLIYKTIDKPESYPMAQPYDFKRSASVWVGDKPLGMIGEFRAEVLSKMKLPKYSAGFEISIEQLLMCANSVKAYKLQSRFPSVGQDLTFKVDAEITYHRLNCVVVEAVEILEKSEKVSIEIEPLDLFQKPGDKPKHVTLRFTVTSFERTLTDKQVNSFLGVIAEATQVQLGAERN